jgi:hypothetical protein
MIKRLKRWVIIDHENTIHRLLSQFQLKKNFNSKFIQDKFLNKLNVIGGTNPNNRKTGYQPQCLEVMIDSGT